MKFPQMEFPRRLKVARQMAGLTQQGVAEKLRITPQSVSGWERGETRPDQDKLSVLARLYDKSVDWLLQGGDLGDLSSEDIAAQIDRPLPARSRSRATSALAARPYFTT